MRMKLADDTMFEIPTEGLPVLERASSNSIGADDDPIKNKFDYVNEIAANDRCYILNSLLFEQNGDSALQRLLSSSTNGNHVIIID